MVTNFGEWLLIELEKRDWSQAKFSRMIGVTRQAVNAYINQRRLKPDQDTLVAIAHALDLPETEVFRAAGVLTEITDYDKIQKEILDYKLAELTPEERDQVLEYIDFLHQRKAKPKYTRQGSPPGEVVK